nr:hypothetical protein [Tanacetum cinerariifolium]
MAGPFVDPYDAIRQAYLVGTDTESKPFEGEAEAPESPHFVAPPTCHVKELEGFGTSGARSTLSDSSAPLLSDHPLTHATPVLVPSLRRTTRMAVCVPPTMSPGFSSGIAKVAAMFDLVFRKSKSEDVEDEGPTTNDDDPAMGDEVLVAGGRGPRMGVESRGLDDESHGLDDEGHGVESDGFGLGEEDEAVLKGQSGFWFAPELERSERMSASRQPTLTTWTYLEDCMVYIDVHVYPPPAPPVQTPPSPKWSSGSFPISLSPSIIPLATATIPVNEDQFIEIDRDVRELYTRSRAVRNEIFSQRYQFRSLEHEQERIVVTFGALWRPVLALEAWSGHQFVARATGDEMSCYYVGAREGP